MFTGAKMTVLKSIYSPAGPEMDIYGLVGAEMTVLESISARVVYIRMPFL